MWVEVFKTGRHTDSSGNTEQYTGEILEQIAGCYNETLRESPGSEAPVVKGHPTSDSPAYGWVERLARRGNKLLAKLKNLEPAFMNELRAGRYKKVSIALYPDRRLRHIGFLGAAQPAVKGLNPANFDEDGLYSLFEYAPELILGQNGKYEFIRTSIEQDVNSNRSEINELKSKLANYEVKFELMEKEKRLEGYREMLGEMSERNGSEFFSPAQIVDFIDILEATHRIDAEEKSKGTFSEANSIQQKVKSLLSHILPAGLTKRLEMSDKSGNGAIYSDFEDKNVSQDRMLIHKRAEMQMQDFPGLSYEEAVLNVLKEEIL